AQVSFHVVHQGAPGMLALMNVGKPFLILQLRPETAAADEEFVSMRKRGGLGAGEGVRVRLDREDLPNPLDLDAFSGVIVGGGPGCVSDPPGWKTSVETRMESLLFELLPVVTARDFPFLGCCAGIGFLGRHLGAPVSRGRYAEPVGGTVCAVTPEGRRDPLLHGIPDTFAALVGHKEALDALPRGAAHLVASPSCPFQMIRYGRNVYATQFHPESDGSSFELRIRIYANYGYFDPSEADDLIRRAHAVNAEASGRVLANFVARYRKTD
ncbi:MAG: glutamine amidotransferase, partial [Opitutales bacterium]|nr:glutamine amidotransferase [Opitutales bacterium]